jgi:erythronate-4-phosphate dehydrogenase
VAQWVFCAIAAWMRIHDSATPKGFTLGVVGVGHIGSIVARWGNQLGYTVLLNDPPRACLEGDESFLPLEELQQRCDIITFHTPLTRDEQWPTWHLCDQRFLDGLTRCRLLLNAARGPIADNAALLGWHGDIGLDCWENEPKISRYLLEKAIVATPHIAGYSREGKQRGTAMMLAALNEFYGWNIPLPTIAAPATGAALVTLEGIAASYDILADTVRLKADPVGFEAFRNHYSHRPEFYR